MIDPSYTARALQLCRRREVPETVRAAEAFGAGFPRYISRYFEFADQTLGSQINRLRWSSISSLSTNIRSHAGSGSLRNAVSKGKRRCFPLHVFSWPLGMSQPIQGTFRGTPALSLGDTRNVDGKSDPGRAAARARAPRRSPVCFEFDRWQSCRLKRRSGLAYARLPLDRRGTGRIQRKGEDLRLRRDSWSRGLPGRAW